MSLQNKITNALYTDRPTDSLIPVYPENIHLVAKILIVDDYSHKNSDLKEKTRGPWWPCIAPLADTWNPFIPDITITWELV